MPNPWEENWSGVNTGNTGNPWEQDWGNTLQGPRTIQEQHPDITTGDRLIVKNLSTSPEAAVSYIKKQHPNLQVELDQSGEIKVKRPEEQDFRVLDPSGITSFTEALKDVGDIGYDVISGGLTSAATAAGGLAGAAGGGIGALPGAIAAGAGASGLLESLRQAAGSAAGIEENIDPSQIFLATGFGGASPVLFGTGATAAQAAKQIAQRGLTGEAAQLAEKALMQQQAGLPSRGLSAISKKFTPKLGSFLSGVPEQTVRDMAESVDTLAQYPDEASLVKYAKEEVKANIEKVNEASSKYYNKLREHIKETVGENTIDVSDAAKSMSDKIDELAAEVKRRPSGDNKKNLEAALEQFDNVWGGKPKKIATPSGLQFNREAYKIAPEELKGITTSIQNVANFSERLPPNADRPRVFDLIEGMGDASYARLQESVDRAAKGSDVLRADLRKVLEDKKLLYREYNPNKVLAKSQTAASGKVQAKAWAQEMKNLDAQYGTNYDKIRGAIAASHAFNKDVPLLSKQRIPAAAIGSLIGYKMAHEGQGEAIFPGVTAGGIVGGVLGGPRAVRAIIEQAARGGMISPITQRLVQPTWNIMQTSRNQRGK